MIAKRQATRSWARKVFEANDQPGHAQERADLVVVPANMLRSLVPTCTASQLPGLTFQSLYHEHVDDLVGFPIEQRPKLLCTCLVRVTSYRPALRVSKISSHGSWWRKQNLHMCSVCKNSTHVKWQKQSDTTLRKS